MKQEICIDVLNRLLVDIAYYSECHIDTSEVIGSDWALMEGPKLDKQLLQYVEGNSREWPKFPGWLLPLSDRVLELIDTDLKNDTPSFEAARYLGMLRQVLVFCYKAEYRPTNEQLLAAQAAFEEAEAGVSCWDRAFECGYCNVTCDEAYRLIGSIIYRINWSEIVPKHGPGGVFPPCLPKQKSDFRSIYSNIQPYYPFDQFFLGIPYYWEALWRLPKRWREVDDIIASLVAVPKDSRGPRLICVHPKESIWIQQGQRALLEKKIERHPLTKGRISFKDQTVNQRLALTSSETREYTTLDLKEASDRISSKLVRALFGEYAYNWLSCSRATHVKLLDGTIVPLKKWAPMGNALCFPVESLIFYALTVSGIRTHYGETCNDVYVFGDDIVFPTKYYDGVVGTLVKFGLIPNMTKTFRRGFFRESCGVEAYGGFDITPLRLKKSQIDTTESVISCLDLAKRLRLAKYDTCASYLYALCRKRLGYLPLCNNPESGGLVEYVHLPATTLMLRERNVFFHVGTQQLAVRHRSCVQAVSRLKTHDWYHEQDSLVNLAHKGEEYGRRVEYPIPYRTRLTYGWTPLHIVRDQE